jgi:hypothetical protein
MHSMQPIQKTARIAGLLYLAIVITGLFNLMYVPGKLIVKGDAAATASNFLAHQTLYRIDFAVGLLSTVIFMFLVLVLYRLFKEVNQQQAALMVILVLVQLPQSYVSQLLQIGAFELFRGADFLSVLGQSDREALGMMCIRLNGLGTHLSELFWGLWLFPLGSLVYRSGFLPRTLGVWLIINGVAYVALSMIGILIPEYVDIAYKFAFPALLGEMAFMLWLVVMGARPRAVISEV